MSFSNDIPGISNQLPINVNLPPFSHERIFLDKLEDALNQITETLNSKEGGLYSLKEVFSFEQFYKQGDVGATRNSYRKVLDFVNLNAANISASASINFAHGISSVEESSGIYAHCTAENGYRFTVVYPYVYCDASNAYFTNPVAFNLTQCDIILNILKEV